MHTGFPLAQDFSPAMAMAVFDNLAAPKEEVRRRAGRRTGVAVGIKAVLSCRLAHATSIPLAVR